MYKRQVFDLQVANYGVARGLPGELAAKDFDDDTPYTPAWQERITGTPREQLITVCLLYTSRCV